MWAVEEAYSSWPPLSLGGLEFLQEIPSKMQIRSWHLLNTLPRTPSPSPTHYWQREPSTPSQAHRGSSKIALTSSLLSSLPSHWTHPLGQIPTFNTPALEFALSLLPSYSARHLFCLKSAPPCHCSGYFREHSQVQEAPALVQDDSICAWNFTYSINSNFGSNEITTFASRKWWSRQQRDTETGSALKETETRRISFILELVRFRSPFPPEKQMEQPPWVLGPVWKLAYSHLSLDQATRACGLPFPGVKSAPPTH